MKSIKLVFGDDYAPRAFSLDGDEDLYAETAEALRGYAPEYTLAAHAVAGVSRPARETSLTLKTHGPKGEARLRALMAAAARQLDTAPAVIDIDGWRQRIQIPRVAARTITPGMCEAELTIALLDGYWICPCQPTLVSLVESGDTDLDHPYDHPHDYKQSSTAISVGWEADSVDADTMLLGLRFFGPAENPSLRIGGNLYEVRTSIPAGGHVHVNPIDRTVTLVTVAGSTTNVFSSATRGTGLDGGSYIFQPLAPARYEIHNPDKLTVSISPYYRRNHLW